MLREFQCFHYRVEENEGTNRQQHCVIKMININPTSQPTCSVYKTISLYIKWMKLSFDHSAILLASVARVSSLFGSLEINHIRISSVNKVVWWTAVTQSFNGWGWGRWIHLHLQYMYTKCIQSFFSHSYVHAAELLRIKLSGPTALTLPHHFIYENWWSRAWIWKRSCLFCPPLY